MAGPDGSMGGFGGYSSSLTAPWGPEFFAGAPWPTASTPSGQNAPDIMLPDHYLEYYYQYFPNGVANGPIRTFRRPSNPFRPYIFDGPATGGPFTDPNDCNAAHVWYSNAGVGNYYSKVGNCPPPVLITGPVTTAAFPALIIYKPDDLLAVKNGTKVDWQVNPSSWIDLS